MDTFELMTGLRNITRKHSETDLSSLELLRCINLANNLISQQLYPLFKDDLVASLQANSQSGSSYLIPADVLLMINVYRENTSSVLKLANKLEVEQKPLIGTNQYPDDEDSPLYVQFGERIEFTPTLSSTDIRFEYRKRIAELVWGIGTSAGDGSYITLDDYAPVKSNVLNGYWLALYKKFDGVLRKVAVEQILVYTYTGGNGIAMFTCPESNQEYVYALVPILPSEFHNYLIDGGLVYLAKSGFYDRDADKLEIGLKDNIRMTLALHGIEYDPKKEGRG
ncbi:MAG: hypothetical protein H8D67_12705 [Deltaproteobacteria bacterium]|nr:hypothetical protein [Deltaproteobacteria bacterium]